MIGSVGALLVTAVLAAVEMPTPPDCPNPVLHDLEKKYTIRVIVEPKFPMKTQYGEIDGKTADPINLETYALILHAEWRLYPAELVRKTKLKRIILCEGLSFAGQARTAVPNFDDNDLYLDVGKGRHSSAYTRLVIHHEFFHIVDWRDDGILYGDERWAALNPKTFKYGSGGKNAQDDNTGSIPNEDNPGFLNRYSTTGVEEDKAEVFAYMIVHDKMIQERAKRDPVLKSKVERMQELIGKFAPKSGKEFWTAVRNRERTSDGQPVEKPKP